MDVTRIPHHRITPLEAQKLRRQLTTLDLAQPLFACESMTSPRGLERTVVFVHVDEGKIERQYVRRSHHVRAREQVHYVGVKILMH